MARQKHDLSSVPLAPSPKSFRNGLTTGKKKVVQTILPTYIRDADHLMKELRLFSVDAIGMYSNIDDNSNIGSSHSVD
jgi:hypothetical protein